MNRSFKSEFIKIAEKKDTVKDLIAGGVGGSISALALNPIDVINTAQQTEGGSIGEVTKKIFKGYKNIHGKDMAGGYKAFYRGLSSKLLKVGPAGAISFAGMMATKKMLDKKYPENK